MKCNRQCKTCSADGNPIDCKRRRKMDDAILGLWMFVIATIFIFALSSLLGGCVYRGAKVTEGTDLAIGFTVPGTEGAVSFDALNYLTGFRLGVAENAALTMEYSTSETNSYFGCVSTCVSKRIKAKVEPCEMEVSK